MPDFEIIHYYVSKLPEKINTIISIILSMMGYFMITDNSVGDFTKLPWSLEVAFAGITMILVISSLLTKISGNFIATKFLLYIKWIGRSSLRFLAIHNHIRVFIWFIIAKLLRVSREFAREDLLCSLIIFFITMIIVFLGNYDK